MRAKKVNNIDDYRKRINETFEREALIYEGLIQSHPLENCLTILARHEKKYIVKQNSDTNSFFLTHTFDDNFDKAIKELSELITLTNNLGWYPCNLTYDPNFKDAIKWDKKQNNIKDLFLQGHRTIKFLFEPKFDTRAITFEKYLYHLAPTIYVKKILKNGLVPRSRSKKAYHPERVYLARSYQDVLRLIPSFKASTKINNWTILLVNTSLSDDLQLYQDQNFKNMGYWTLNPITSASLSIYSEDNPETDDNYLRHINRDEHKQTRGIRKKPGDKTPNYEF